MRTRFSKLVRFLSLPAPTRSGFCLIAVAMLLPTTVLSQGGTPLWTNRYTEPGVSHEQPAAIAVDAAGNVVVTGNTFHGFEDCVTVRYSSDGTPLWTHYGSELGYAQSSGGALALDRNGNVLVAGSVKPLVGAADYMAIKYSGDGVVLWVNNYNGPANWDDFGQAVVADANGDVIVTGASQSNNYYNDYATVKYSNDGMGLWTNRYNAPSNRDDTALRIAVDRHGNVVVTGASEGNNGYGDFATIAYSSTGVPLWTNRYNGPANGFDAAYGLAVDISGNVIVTGPSGGASTLVDYATIKYASTGVAWWTNRYDGPGHQQDYARAVAVDASGNVFVTGFASNGTNTDYATIAYSSAGVPLWTNRYNGPGNQNDEAMAVGVDSRGNVFVTGNSHNGTNMDYATIAYSSAGVPLWTNRYNGPSDYDDNALRLAVDAAGNVYVTGWSYDSASGVDFVTIKYAAVPPGPCVITNTFLAGSSLVFSGAGGSADGTYYVLSSTNVADAITNWVRTATNQFGAGGTFIVTNSVDPFRPRQFFRVEAP